MSFKIGDEVITLDPAGEINCGEYGVIEEIVGKGEYYGVYLTDIQKSIAYLPSELKLIEEDKTMQKFYIETEGESHSQILQELAFEEGYSWFSDKGKSERSEVSYKYTKYLYFNFDNKTILKSKHENATDYKKLKDYSLKEFKQALNGEYDFNSKPDIELFDHEVEFYDNSIKVGCQEYTLDDIQDVVKVLNLNFNFNDNLKFQLVVKDDCKVVPKNKIKQIAEYYDLL